MTSGPPTPRHRRIPGRFHLGRARRRLVAAAVGLVLSAATVPVLAARIGSSTSDCAITDHQGCTDPAWELESDALIPRIKAHFEERIGGIWLESDVRPVIIHVSVVDPTADDETWLADEVRGRIVGAAIHSARYTRKELERFHDRVDALIPFDLFSSTWVDPVTNTLQVELTRSDPEVEARLRSAVPADALVIGIDPNATGSLD